jgi:hypothetical protein
MTLRLQALANLSVVTFIKSDKSVCYGSSVLKLIVSKTESRVIRAAAKQIGDLHGGGAQMHEKRCELREKTDRRLTVTCDLSPFPKGTNARILKAIVKRLKKIVVRLLLWLHVPFTN